MSSVCLPIPMRPRRGALRRYMSLSRRRDVFELWKLSIKVLRLQMIPPVNQQKVSSSSSLVPCRPFFGHLSAVVLREGLSVYNDLDFLAFSELRQCGLMKEPRGKGWQLLQCLPTAISGLPPKPHQALTGSGQFVSATTRLHSPINRRPPSLGQALLRHNRSQLP